MSKVNHIFSFEGVEEIIIEAHEEVEFVNTTHCLLIVTSGVALLNSTINLMSTTVFLGNVDFKIHIKNSADKPFVCRLFNFNQFKLRHDDGKQLTYEFVKEYVNYYGLFYHKASNKVKKVSDLLYYSDSEQLQAHLIYKLLYTVEQEYSMMKTTPSEISFQTVLSYVANNSHKNLKRDEVAKYFGYHPNYFSKRIKSETGWSFSDYLSHIRLDKAKIYLLNSTLTIAEVARQVGYQDGLYLSRKFRKQTGLSPTEFRSLKRYKRIFTFQFTGALLALGIEPVGTISWAANIPSHYAERLTDTLLIQNDDFPVLEQLSALNLDLIIGPSYLYAHPELIESLEKIAPVFIFDWDEMDRIEEVNMIARMIGQEEKATNWRISYEEKIEKSRTLLQPFIEAEETFGIYELRPNNTVGVWRSSARGAYNIYEMLKLKRPKSIQTEILERNKHIVIAENRIGHFAADHMFVVVHTKEQALRLYDNDIWQILRKKIGKKIYVLELEDFWASEGIFLEKQLDIQLKKLLEKDYIL